MVVGSYLITSTHMRIFDEKGPHFFGPDTPEPTGGLLTLTRLKERCERVFKMIPEKMKNLVIVNSYLLYFEKIQACVEVSEKYANNIMVIPPLLALITYALEDIAQYKNPPKDEVLFIVIMTTQFIDFIILQRNQNFDLQIEEYVHFEVEECEEMFPKFYNHFYPHSTIFLAQEPMNPMAEHLRAQFKPDMCFIKLFKHWDYVLLYGGMLRAMDDDDGFDTRYHLSNFSSGYDTRISDYKTRREERKILLPERSKIPCKIYGIDCVPQAIKLFYFKDYHQSGKELVLEKRGATSNSMFLTGKSTQILGYIDERGVPFAVPPRENTTAADSRRKEPPKMAECKKADPNELKNQAPLLNNNAIPPSDTDTGIFSLSSPPSTSSLPISNDPPVIKFLFGEKYYGTEIYQNGVTRLLADSTGNEWTPTYLSMAEGTVEIGEKAKQDYQRFPRRVIYDVLKIIGKPLNKIEIDRNWGFKLAEIDGTICFQVETPTDPIQIPQEIVISAFLKAMKLRTQSILGNGIEFKEICLSTGFRLTESQKAVFRKAATKNHLDIDLFIVTDIN